MVCLSSYAVDHVLLLRCANRVCVRACVRATQMWPPSCSGQNQVMQALLMLLMTLLPIQGISAVQDQTGV